MRCAGSRTCDRGSPVQHQISSSGGQQLGEACLHRSSQSSAGGEAVEAVEVADRGDGIELLGDPLQRMHSAYAENRLLIHCSPRRDGETVRAATYARLSDDGLSIPDQLASSRKYAEDRGWQVVDDFVDRHKSAFRKVEREGFEALLAALTPGRSTRSSRGTKIV
jgi:hypothetical protein